ncbi:MAG: thiamine pyrophosphate-dependent enzyme [Ginsengibacter sp.]
MQIAINHKLIKKAITIRTVEEKFMNLFSEGKLNGTVHTCVGQEFSAIAFAGQLDKKDFIFSNHRCHGHYIAFTGDVRGLIAELMGKASGTSGGIGSSQHLCNHNFFSNGIQGGIVPVAAGYAFGNKLKNNGAIGMVFIGDGTLGEGVLYETLNIISKWEIPLLIVCENNHYAQSTPQTATLAGNIADRAAAFGIRTGEGTTDDPGDLVEKASDAIAFVREQGKPFFFVVDTARLNPHSKGDDNRDPGEISGYRDKDFLEIFSRSEPGYFKKYQEAITRDINNIVNNVIAEDELPVEKYYVEEMQQDNDSWQPARPVNKRQVELLNIFFKENMGVEQNMILIGEDVVSPYGGAFKVSRDLSDLFPERVISTPISEAAIVGISNGLALNGFKPFVEIMFGDFITLAFDQVVNHASKFHHMFNKQVNCPVVIRTPMGGRRGYGPTHSQTLDKFLIGIDNIKTVALNTLVEPGLIYESVLREVHPVIVIENKTDYGKKILNSMAVNFTYQRNGDAYPVVKVQPVKASPTLTIFAYGGMADLVNAMLNTIFTETGQKPELIVPSLISRLPLDIIGESVKRTGRLLVVEEGSAYGGIGGELIGSLTEKFNMPFKAKRIAAFPVPIPSVKSLENIILPGEKRIIEEIIKSFD